MLAALFSIVVPVSNEATILEDSLSRMLEELKTIGTPFEVVICENGSLDGTFKLAEIMQRLHAEIRVESLPFPNYGLALKRGISVCRYDVIVIFNIDFWSVDFLRVAIAKLDDHDMVIGSKTMKGARDQRPLIRRMITRSFTRFLRICFGFRGTDTHGMKAFRRDAILGILDCCITDRSIFDTELVLRTERRGLRITEVPVHVTELRQPSYWSLLKRVPETVLNLVQMYLALRMSSR